MNRYVKSIIMRGSVGILTEIECQLSNGLPAIVIVGLGNKAVDEAKERIRSAFASTGIPLPRKRITINLAPADIPKDSTSLDLAIALAIMSSGKHTFPAFNDFVVIGEVGLDGSTRPARGIIGKLMAGKKLGIHKYIVPYANLAQAQLVPDIELLPVKSLKELAGDYAEMPPLQQSNYQITPTLTGKTDDLAMISGQQQAKRALIIAAAGGHNILLTGPPGTGKSMLARSLHSLLPPLSHQEMLEVTHLHSLASNDYSQLIRSRPLRSPHHGASHSAIIGGGALALPGEVSLSHFGVLFMDELPEFDRATLEALRQPLENREVIISRAKHTISYPARFILAATANPCPCGYFGTSKPCRCTSGQILRYQQKLSGPILDRIDLHVTVDKVDHGSLLAKSDESTQPTRELVKQARNTQTRRFGKAAVLNADMDNGQIARLARLSPDALELLNTAARQLDISARSYMKAIKIARTIADLARSKEVLAEHISESLQYRPVSRQAI